MVYTNEKNMDLVYVIFITIAKSCFLGLILHSKRQIKYDIQSCLGDPGHRNIESTSSDFILISFLFSSFFLITKVNTIQSTIIFSYETAEYLVELVCSPHL